MQKKPLQNKTAPEWLLKHVLIRFINTDKFRNFKGTYQASLG